MYRTCAHHSTLKKISYPYQRTNVGGREQVTSFQARQCVEHWQCNSTALCLNPGLAYISSAEKFKPYDIFVIPYEREKYMAAICRPR